MFNTNPMQGSSRLAELANPPMQMASADRFQPQQEQGLLPAAMDANQYRKVYQDYVLSTMESGEQPLQYEEFVRAVQNQQGQ